MKKLVVFYSFSGTTKVLAQAAAAKENADLYEIKEKNRPSTVGAYTAGVLKAIRSKPVKHIEPVSVDFSKYNEIHLFSPVWAGAPAPPVYNFLDALPNGKNITITMVSKSGHSSAKDRIREILKSKGCQMISYHNVKKG